MRIFISWSGPRSRKVAEYLSGWLRKLPLTVRPWVSREAIDPGTRWEKELSEALEGTSFGILCLTPENQLESWICFEAGALSKTVEKTYVIPYLIDMRPEELKQPLKQFQAIEATKDGTFQLVKTIHKASGDDVHSLDDVKETFEALWPKLQENIEAAQRAFTEPPVTQEPGFPEIKDDLGKIVSLLESLSSRMTKLESAGSITPPWKLDKYTKEQSRLSDIIKDNIEFTTARRLHSLLSGAVSEQAKTESNAYIKELLKELEAKGMKGSKTEKEES